ncbi:MAG: hypothetical protein ACETWE_07320 [Candidatus Bathyarchaeia archaeon]
MVAISSENVSMLIGRPVKDNLNRAIGEVLSFIIDSSGDISEILVKDNNGEHLCYPVARFAIDGDAVRLLSEIDMKVEMISKNIPLLWRKKEILDRLLEGNKILPQIHEKLHADFDEKLASFKSDAQTVMEELGQQVKDYESLFRTLHFAKTYLDIEHEIGRVKEEAYRQSMIAILNGLRDVVDRKNALDEKRETLSNIFIGEETATENIEKQSIQETTIQRGQEKGVVEEEEQKEAFEGADSEPVITVHMK